MPALCNPIFHRARCWVGWIPLWVSALLIPATLATAQSVEPDLTRSADQRIDFSTRKLSDAGKYRVSLRPHETRIAIGKLHGWVFNIKASDGEEFMPTQMAVAGGMPEHGHGFPSSPRVTRYLGNGDFLVEGVKFNMAGRWLFKVGLQGPSGWDTATFNLVVRTTANADIAGGLPVATTWRAPERQILASLSLDALSKLPEDPSNRAAHDPRAARFGHQLFFDPGLSASKTAACATCHQPRKLFTDGRPRSKGAGETPRNAPSLVGAAYSPWLYWDGRRDSLWAQALTPMEAAEEMANTRTAIVRYVLEHTTHGPTYRALFRDTAYLDEKLGALPDDAGPFGNSNAKVAWARMAPAAREAVNTAFANIGKAIAAYETVLAPAPSRFDEYVKVLLREGEHAASGIFNDVELAGLRLFIDGERTRCLRCHNGPLFTNHGFHNIGSGNFDGPQLDYGRLFGLRAALYDEFNCTGRYSDNPPEQCKELIFVNRDALPAEVQGAFKVPSLRNVAETGPYLHDGRFATLAEVLRHYREPPNKEATLHELEPMPLSEAELGQLAAFLGTLTGGVDAKQRWLKTPEYGLDIAAGGAVGPEDHGRNRN